MFGKLARTKMLEEHIQIALEAAFTFRDLVPKQVISINRQAKDGK